MPFLSGILPLLFFLHKRLVSSVLQKPETVSLRNHSGVACIQDSSPPVYSSRRYCTPFGS